jgi:SHS2 domain-containing protein
VRENYRILDHTADLRIEAWGKGVEGLFVSAARALTDLLVDIETIEEREEKTISADGDNREELLVDMLREVLFLFSGESFLSSRFVVIELSDRRVLLHLWGERFDEKKHAQKIELKAVTYHGLVIERRGALYHASILFDV